MSATSVKQRLRKRSHLNAELSEEQHEAKLKIRNNAISIVTGKAGTGKAQPLYSKVLTPRGYVKMDDVEKNDFVISPNGNKTKVLEVYPQGLKDVYKVKFSDGSEVECCGEHLWKTSTRKNERYGNKREWSVKSLSHIINTLKDGKVDNHYIPITDPVNFESRDVSIPPYILGVLIGDGSITSSNIKFSTSDDSVMENVSNLLGNSLEVSHVQDYDYVLKVKNKSSSCVKVGSDGNIIEEFKSISEASKKTGLNISGIYRACEGQYKKCGEYKWEYTNKKTSNNWIKKSLKKYGLFGKKSNEKFVPDDYLYNEKKIRLELLRGLLDSDGYVSNDGDITYSTVSKELFEDVKFLVESLGGITYDNIKTNVEYSYNGEKRNGKNAFVLRIKLDLEPNIFKLERKEGRRKEYVKYPPSRSISEVEYIGKRKCKCIRVDHPEGLYLTENFIVTHNTFLGCYTACEMFLNNEVDKIVVTRPTVTQEEIGFLPGDVEQKLDPWLKPIYNNLYEIFGREMINQMDKEDYLQIVPVTFMRGRTFSNAAIIVDEFQNLKPIMVKMIMSRIGLRSTMMFTGDENQVDLDRHSRSGYRVVSNGIEDINDICKIHLESNYRHPILDDLLDYFEEHDV